MPTYSQRNEGDVSAKLKKARAAAQQKFYSSPAQRARAAAGDADFWKAAARLGIPKGTRLTLDQMNKVGAILNEQGYEAAQGPKWIQDLALGVNLAGLGFAGAGALGAFSEAGGVAPVTAASVAPDTGALTAANAAAPAFGGSMSTDIAAGTVSLGSAPSASVLPTAADLSVSAPSLSLGATAPAISAAAPSSALASLSQYTPKNLVSSGLTSAGVPSGVASAAGGAVQGAGMSALTGGNPVTGAITGGVSGGVGEVTGSPTLGSAAGKIAGYELAPTTSGGKMADPLNPMPASTSGTAPATVPSSPTATATQGLPSLPTTGMPNGAATTSPSGILDSIGTGVSSVIGSLTGGLIGTPSSSTSMAPYLAIGALGFAEADKAKKEAQAQADAVAKLGAPYTAAGTKLLNDYSTGTLTPAQKTVVDTAIANGNTILASDPQLQAIYTQAFGDYASGTLRPADQLKLDQTVAAQKAQLRQNLSSMGITDSTILAAQDQQIDNQAIMTKQALLDAQFQTGNQAFSTWLRTTEDGMKMIQDGQMFAVTSLQQTFNNALQAGQTGMNPVIQSVQMQIAADAQLGTAVSDLLGNLAKAYAYTQYQNSPAARGGTTGTTGGGGGARPRVPGTSTGQVGSSGVSPGAGNQTGSMPGATQTDPVTGQPITTPDIPTIGAPTGYGTVLSSPSTDPTTGTPYDPFSDPTNPASSDFWTTSTGINIDPSSTVDLTNALADGTFP